MTEREPSAVTRDAAPAASRFTRLTRDAAGVAELTLSTGHPLTLLSTPVISDLTDVLRKLAVDDSLRVLIMRGVNDRAFIGGADINEMAALDAASAVTFISGLRGLCDAVRDLPVPVIARLSGWCLGGGLEVAAACDLRIADHSARFAMPEVKIGMPSVIHAALLPRLIGVARAQWLLLTGETIDAMQAQQWGLVEPMCAIGELDTTIARTAAGLAALAPQVLRQQKALMRSWQDQPLAAALDASVVAYGAAFETGEPQRETAKFLARKRA